MDNFFSGILFTSLFFTYHCLGNGTPYGLLDILKKDSSWLSIAFRKLSNPATDRCEEYVFLERNGYEILGVEVEYAGTYDHVVRKRVSDVRLTSGGNLMFYSQKSPRVTNYHTRCYNDVNLGTDRVFKGEFVNFLRDDDKFILFSSTS